MDTLLIYTEKKTNRLRYTFKLVFGDLLRISYRITTELDEFQSSDLPKMVYAEQPYSDGLFVKSSGLLFQRGVGILELKPFPYGDMMAFFPVDDKSSQFPFDVFSAIFYLISRYEEYQPFVKDFHGRFTASQSILAELGMLQKPVVNIWALELKNIIQNKYPDFKFTERKYKFTPTYDIDSAYAFVQKGPVRTLGGFFLDLKKFDWSNLAQRARVVFGFEKDPYNTFDLQIEYQKKYKLRPIYFILYGRYGKYDKNVNVRNRTFRQLIKLLGDYAQIGIHPSYKSSEHPDELTFEVNSLSHVLNRDVTYSRQHFLRLMLPVTYRNLIEHDITHDFTMGYADLPGFRAGICCSFNFYDLDTEEETKLRIHPFTLMDGTLRDYMKLTAADAIDLIKLLIKEVKAVNGTFISLWHNESLSDQKRWVGWRRVYEALLEEAVEKL